MTAAPGSLTRAAVGMTGLNVVSRLTGLARVLAVAGVLGPTYLGNVYQSANTVPNIVFELFVAGALQAALIPGLVRVLDHHPDGHGDDAEHVAGSVLGLVLAVLGVLAAVGALLAPLVMAGLVSGVDDRAVRDDQIELGVVFLWVFLPQVLFYGAGLVATAVLNAKERFLLPVAAPIVNNLVVVGVLVAFAAMTDGPGLDLSSGEVALLAGGTTLGVILFTSLPFVAVLRSGFRLRPRFDHRHPAVRRIFRDGAWAAAWLAGTQVLLAAVLVVANGVEGGVIVWHVGLTFFFLPHALLGFPVMTALFPRISRQVGRGDTESAGHTVTTGIRLIALLTIPAGVALAVLGGAAARTVLVGEGTAAAGELGGVLAGFALGLPAYSGFLYLTRALYAAGDTRTPARVAWAMAVLGAAGTALVAAAASDADRVAGLAVAFSLAHVVGVTALLVRLGRLLPLGVGSLGPDVVRVLVVAAAAAAAMVGSSSALPEVTGRLGVALWELTVPALAGLVGAGLVDAAFGGHVRRALAGGLGDVAP